MRNIPVTYTRQCRSGLYSIPNEAIKYLGIWISGSEDSITKATFALIKYDMDTMRACGIPTRDPSSYLNNYQGCVRNVVNLIYKDIAVGKEVSLESPLNTRKVTGNVRSYLKSVLAMKSNCAPKG